MSAGRLIAVVGPSGVGKDSVMGALAAVEPRVHLVRRVITRPAELGGEPFEGVPDDEFDRRRSAGAFALHWAAHGLRYGVPRSELAGLAAGGDALVNLSRAVLTQARQVAPQLVVIRLSATPETLGARLAARGREDADQIARRLSRAALPLPGDLPADVKVWDIPNDGALEGTVADIRARLYPVRA